MQMSLDPTDVNKELCMRVCAGEVADRSSVILNQGCYPVV